MPRLMDKKDWMQTVADVEAAESVWCENISGETDSVSFSLPGSGNYRVIFVKLEKDGKAREVPPGHKCRDVSPRVRALRGAAKAFAGRDYKTELVDALSERYEALG